MRDPREIPEWLQREADEIAALTRREARRVLFWRTAITATFTAAALLGLRALLAWL